jgi:hypothetical protein
MAFSFNRICSNTIPEGRYKAQVTDVKFKTSSTGEASNDLQIHLTITEGAYAKKVIVDTILEKVFSWRLKPFLMACGIDMNKEFSSARELYEYGIRSAKGKTVLVDIVVKPYNGVDYNNVKDYAALPGSTTSVDDVMAEFDTPVGAMPSKPTVADVPDLSEMESPIADISDEDIPF